MNLGEKEKEGPDPYKFNNSEDESCKTIREKIKERQKKLPLKKKQKSGRSLAYAAVVTVQKSSDAVAVSSSSVEEKKEGKGLNFLQRMKIRDKREVEAGLLASVETLRLKKYPAAKRRKTSATPKSKPVKPNPIEEINCSPEMKKFMISEYEREKKVYSNVPEAQVANSIIHRLETLKANSGKKINRSKSQNEKVKEVSAEDTEREADSEELNISEFDEDDLNLKPPPAGSFSLSPPPSMLKMTKNLLVRFTTDGESPSIANKARKMSRKDLVLKRYGLDLDETSPSTEVSNITKSGGRSSKRSSRLVKSKVVEVEPRSQSPVSFLVHDSPVSVERSSATSQRDARVRKTVTMNFKPEFLPLVTDELYQCSDMVCVPDGDVNLKSILKKTSPPQSDPPASPRRASPAKILTRSQVKVNLLAKFNQSSEKADNTNKSAVDKLKSKMLQLSNLVSGKVCGHCRVARKVVDLRLCSVCTTVAYCDVECQRGDWASHKFVCRKFAGLTIREKKDLVLKVFGWDVIGGEESNSSVKTPENEEVRTPETSPSLVNSIRSQSVGRFYKRRLRTLVGRKATPYHSELARDLDLLAGPHPVQRKLIFAEFDVNDEVFEESQVVVYSDTSEDMFAESSPEEDDVSGPKDDENELPNSLLSLSDSEAPETDGDRLSGLFSDHFTEEEEESSADL